MQVLACSRHYNRTHKHEAAPASVGTPGSNRTFLMRWASRQPELFLSAQGGISSTHLKAVIRASPVFASAGKGR